jgi:hypothetical protein
MAAVHGTPHIDHPRSGRPAGTPGAGGGRPGPAPRAGGAFWAAAAAIAAAGTGLRLLAARGDLWLDEIWSLELARLARTAAGVLTSVHHDNNHHLTTGWLLLLGPDAPPLALRALAVAAGAATLGAVALRASRVGRPEALAGLLLLAFSPLLVHYGSEARGYSLAVLAAVVAAEAQARWLEGRRARWAAAVAAASIVGFLSHLTFLYVWAALLAWAAAAWLAGPPPRRAPGALLAALGAAGAAFAALWAVDLRFLAVGGGPPYDLAEVLREWLDATLALPRGPLEVAGLVAVAVAAREVARLAREGRPEWAFHATVLAAAPAAVLAWTRPAYLAPRYLAVAAPFLLLLLARAGARAWVRGGGRRLAAAGAAMLFLAGSAVQVGRLLRDGRGRYREAVAYMVRASPPGGAWVASDHDFRNGTVLAFHARRVPGGSGLRYVPAGDPRGPVPDWVLLHDFDAEAVPPEGLEGPGGRRYRLDARFRSAPLSGWNWTLYRLDGPP